MSKFIDLLDQFCANHPAGEPAPLHASGEAALWSRAQFEVCDGAPRLTSAGSFKYQIKPRWDDGKWQKVSVFCKAGDHPVLVGGRRYSTPACGSSCPVTIPAGRVALVTMTKTGTSFAFARFEVVVCDPVEG